MKDINEQKVLVIFGAFTIIYGLLEANWYGIYLTGIGISWAISSLIFGLSKRKITEGGLVSSLFFGFIGAIVWMVIDISRKQVAQEKGRINAETDDQKSISSIFDSNIFLTILFLLSIAIYRAHFLLENEVNLVITILFAIPLVSCLLFAYLQVQLRIDKSIH